MSQSSDSCAPASQPEVQREGRITTFSSREAYRLGRTRSYRERAFFLSSFLNARHVEYARTRLIFGGFGILRVHRARETRITRSLRARDTARHTRLRPLIDSGRNPRDRGERNAAGNPRGTGHVRADLLVRLRDVISRLESRPLIAIEARKARFSRTLASSFACDRSISRIHSSDTSPSIRCTHDATNARMYR